MEEKPDRGNAGDKNSPKGEMLSPLNGLEALEEALELEVRRQPGALAEALANTALKGSIPCFKFIHELLLNRRRARTFDLTRAGESPAVRWANEPEWKGESFGAAMEKQWDEMMNDPS